LREAERNQQERKGRTREEAKYGTHGVHLPGPKTCGDTVPCRHHPKPRYKPKPGLIVPAQPFIVPRLGKKVQRTIGGPALWKSAGRFSALISTLDGLWFQ